MEMVELQQSGGRSTAAAAMACRRPEEAQEHEHEQEGAEEAEELRRGPWTVDEDLTLINYIAEHGEGRWNALARAAGLKRTGKSCRLRWLNYLRPDVKRGDFTADEQLLILDLHSRWGNRWSKIAQHLPGRTDNEIKNYWRTRVQKHAKQLNCDVNSKRFKDAMRFLWMPRLAERAISHHHHHAAAAGDLDLDITAAAMPSSCVSAAAAPPTTATTTCLLPAAANANAELESCSYHHSPGSVAVTSSSCSDSSSLTSTELDHCSTQHEAEKVMAMTGGGEYLWTTATALDHEFWSTAAPAFPLPQLHDVEDECHHQFLDAQELSGWVQGFSEGVSENLWSLEDIWRMQ